MKELTATKRLLGFRIISSYVVEVKLFHFFIWLLILYKCYHPAIMLHYVAAIMIFSSYLVPGISPLS